MLWKYYNMMRIFKLVILDQEYKIMAHILHFWSAAKLFNYLILFSLWLRKTLAKKETSVEVYIDSITKQDISPFILSRHTKYFLKQKLLSNHYSGYFPKTCYFQVLANLISQFKESINVN